MTGSRKSAVVFTGGVLHPFESATPALMEILSEVGFDCRVSCDMPEILQWIAATPSAVLVIYALRWSMTQHEKYAQDRARWAFTLSAQGQAAIANHVASGGGLLGIHTATICFDDWQGWGNVLGGAWEWGKSHHPPLGDVQTRLDRNHFLAHGLGDFELTDEVYSEQRLAGDANVFGWAAAKSNSAAAGREQPVLWTHGFGRGRVVADTLGHDAASLQHPVHRRLLQRAAAWASGQPAQTVENM